MDMPPLVDSHCHLNYLEEPAARLQAARARGINGFLCIGVDHKGLADVQALASAHPDVWASAGVHPDAASEVTAARDWLPPALNHPEVIAVGEMGLDYARYPDAATRSLQQECFEFQLDLASRVELPVIIHTRGAQNDTLALLRAKPTVKGVLHCFTESWEMASAALDLGYYVSMSGIVTFKNAQQVREVAQAIPSERLLVETDAPWLAPVPNRGKTNEPAFVLDTAQFVADLRGVSLAELAQQTTANFSRLFGCAVSRD